jgi:hypothetical protein
MLCYAMACVRWARHGIGRLDARWGARAQAGVLYGGTVAASLRTHPRTSVEDGLSREARCIVSKYMPKLLL